MIGIDDRLITEALAPAAFGSMWLDPQISGKAAGVPRLTGPLSCDLLVVGGGYTGLWTALHAAERNPARPSGRGERVGWRDLGAQRRDSSTPA